MAKHEPGRAGRIPRDPFDPLDGPVHETLDLHGFRAAEVRERLGAFLAGARRRQPGGLVHIITGKGRGSSGGPVLRGLVRTILRSGELTSVEAWGPDMDDGGWLLRLKV
jgi:DNA-nicking Smr family endonuclease